MVIAMKLSSAKFACLVAVVSVSMSKIASLVIVPTVVSSLTSSKFVHVKNAVLINASLASCVVVNLGSRNALEMTKRQKAKVKSRLDLS